MSTRFARVLRLMILCGGVASPGLAQPQASIPLNVPQVLVGDVAPGQTGLEVPFLLSGVEAFRLDAIVPVNGVQMAIRDPQGVVVVPSGDPRVAYTAGTVVSPTLRPPGGTFVTQEIAAPVSGEWRLILTFPAAPERTAVQVTLMTRTRYRAGVALAKENFVVGEFASIGLIVLAAGLPVTPTEIVSGPTLTVQALAGGQALNDVGQDGGSFPDGLANDGIFSAGFTFGAAGKYEVRGSVEIATSAGNIVRTATHRVEVRAPNVSVGVVNAALLTGPNLCVTGIAINVPTTAEQPSDIIVTAVLRASNSRTLVRQDSFRLALGSTTSTLTIPVNLLIAELGANGPYELAKLEVSELRDGAYVTVYEAATILNTSPVDLARACLAPVTLESGLEVVPSVQDGFISQLQLRFSLSVATAGTYSFAFKVLGPAGEDLALIASPRGLSAGRNTVSFVVNSSSLLSVDGPYSVTSLLVTGPAGSASLSRVGNTPAFARWQFLPRINGDLDNDGDVDAADQAFVLAARNAKALVPGDRRDLDRNGRIDIADVRVLQKLACASGACPIR